jgi:hypothetical protein
MFDESTLFIETPRTLCRPERIDVLLERRMKEFLLERRRRLWRDGDE